MEREGALDIENLVRIAETLEKVVSPCFGPRGGQVLFTRATGDILITRDGGTILESLLLDHPAARWMVSRALGHRQRTGDGAKSFLLLLAALLRAARAEAGAGGVAGRHRLARGLARLERDLLPGLLCRGLGPDLDLGPGPGPGREAVARVLTAYLSGRVSAARAALLGRLASELLWRLAGGELGRAARLCAQSPAGLLLAVAGLPAARSRVLEGLPLGQGLAVGGRPGPGTALLLAGGLAPALTEPGLTLRPGAALALAQARARGLERTVARLRGLGVGLLLSGPRQPACALRAAEAGGLALVHGLAEPELELVRRLTGAEPVRRADQARAADAVPVRFVRPLGPGLLLGLAGRRGLRPHCLVLCAPTLGLAQQHRDAVAGACRLLGLLLPEPGEPGAPGGEGPDPGDQDQEGSVPGRGAAHPEVGGTRMEGAEPEAPGWEGPDSGAPVKGRESRDPGGNEDPDPGSRREGPNAGVSATGSEGDVPGTPGWGREGDDPETTWWGSEGDDPETPGWGRDGDDPETPGWGRDGDDPGMGREGQCARDLGKAGGQTEGQNGLDVERTQSSEPRRTPSDPSGAFPSPLTPAHCPQPPPTGPACEAGEWQLPAGCVLPAGGAFEFLLHHYLQCEGDRQQEHDTRLACRLVAQALLNIPRHLQRGPRPGRDLLRAHADFERRLREGRALPVDRGPLEVVAAKGQLVTSALQCLRSLLSVDRAVAVRGRLRDAAQAESEDSE